MTTIWGHLKNGNGVEVAHFLDIVNESIIIDMAESIACDPTLGFNDIVVENDNEGIIWKRVFADKYDEPADIDSDMGFDPYEGCCTWDC